MLPPKHKAQEKTLVATGAAQGNFKILSQSQTDESDRVRYDVEVQNTSSEVLRFTAEFEYGPLGEPGPATGPFR